MGTDSSPSAPSVGSLCSGYGGLDMGLALGLGTTLRHAWHVEYDANPSKILDHHWPGVPNHGDVKHTDWAAVEPVDVLTAGYPCQPFSAAGLRKGADDPRHLWPGVARAISVLRPRLVLLENVRGHVSLGFDAVLGDLAELGYDATWGVVRASDAGAPHSRARLFILATDADAAPQRWGRSEGQQRGLGTAGLQPVALADAQDDRRQLGIASGRAAEQPRAEGDHCAAPDAGGGQLAGPATARLGLPVATECGDRAAADATGDRRDEGRTEPARLVGGSDAPERGSAAAADTDSLGLEGVGRFIPLGCDVDGRSGADISWGDYEPAIRRWESITGRPAPRPTEPGRTGERLSPRFVEWMMGLPVGWVTDVPGLPRNAQLKALGNGVVPQQAALALRLLGLTRGEVAA